MTAAVHKRQSCITGGFTEHSGRNDDISRPRGLNILIEYIHISNFLLMAIKNNKYKNELVHILIAFYTPELSEVRGSRPHLNKP